MSDEEFTLEKLKINEQIQDLKTNQALVMQKQENDSKMIADIHIALLGDGTSEKIGLVTRVDRLEQTKEHVKWTWTAIAALLGEHIRHLWSGK